MDRTTYRWKPAATRSITSSSAQTAVIGTAPAGRDAGSIVVRLYATVECHIEIGANPTATTSSTPLGEKVAEYVEIKPGDRIAVIRASADGTLFVTECESPANA